MKKILLFAIISFIGLNIVFASGSIYSDNYVKHLKDCSVYIEKYDAQIPANDENSTPLNIKTTESVLGWKNGKCLTKSVVYCKDMNQDILSSHCAFSESQLDNVVKKMQNIKSKNSKNKQQLQNDLTKYIKDNALCVTKNLIR